MRRARVMWQNTVTGKTGCTELMPENQAEATLARFVGQEDVRFEHWLEPESEGKTAPVPELALSVA